MFRWLFPNAQEYLQRGQAKFVQEDYSGALREYDKTITLNPTIPHAYYSRGNAKAKLQNYQGAIHDYSQTLNLNPNLAVSCLARGIVKQLLGHNQDVLQDYDKAIKLAPAYPNAYICRGYASLRPTKLSRRTQRLHSRHNPQSQRPQSLYRQKHRSIPTNRAD